ncbi:MAG: enoyl-CoA hydratase [Myxococcota bacterium]
MTEPVLNVERDEGIAVLTLHRPEAMNALSRELRQELTRTFRALRDDEGVGVAILTGSGKAFCAGLDLKELGSEGGAQDANRIAGEEGSAVIAAMRELGKPIIGAVNGFAITGGFELALACDVLICSTAARFADTHARVGIMPGWGLSQILPRVIGPYRARELSLTGNFLEAETAERWGLVNRVVAPEELLHTCKALARDMLSCDPEVLRAYKRNIDEGWETTYADGRRMEVARFRAHMRTLSPSAIAERRRAVTERGRSQSG